MKYMKLTDEQKERHPSIHYTGSVRGMKKLGYWGKHDVCVRCGQYIYNISIWLDPNRSNKTERPKEELPQAYLDILEKREWSHSGPMPEVWRENYLFGILPERTGLHNPKRRKSSETLCIQKRRTKRERSGL